MEQQQPVDEVEEMETETQKSSQDPAHVATQGADQVCPSPLLSCAHTGVIVSKQQLVNVYRSTVSSRLEA